MPRTLAKGRTRLDMFAAADLPADLAAITVIEFGDAVPLSSIVLTDSYKFTAAASDTVSQPALNEVTNTSVFDASNFTAEMWFFRYLTLAGLSDPLTDIAWAALKVKGTELLLVERRSLLSGADWVVAQEYLAVPVMCDNPLNPDDTAGYQRFGQTFGVTGDGVYGAVA